MNLNEPLVSVLIPTYNRPVYFEQALKSVLAQTYRNIEIIIGDDSTNDDTEQLIQPYLKQYPLIRYIRNKQKLGQFENDLMLMEASQGEFINMLMDDDLFHPQKLEMMVPHLRDHSELGIVTSHRQGIDANSNLLPLVGVTIKITTQTAIFNKESMAQMVFANPFGLINFNFIGEPTTALFRKNSLKVPFGTFAGRRYGCNVDLATWFSLMLEGTGLYLTNTLSYFRIHQGQQMNNIHLGLMNITDHAHSLITTPQYGFINTISNEYELALRRYFEHLSIDFVSKMLLLDTNIEENFRASLIELYGFTSQLSEISKIIYDEMFSKVIHNARLIL